MHFHTFYAPYMKQIEMSYMHYVFNIVAGNCSFLSCSSLIAPNWKISDGPTANIHITAAEDAFYGRFC